MVNSTTDMKAQEPVIEKSTEIVKDAPKKIPAPIPDVNVWQIKKSVTSTSASVNSNGKLRQYMFE
jgi:hypothetical protein